MFGAPKISPPHYTMMIQGTDVLAVAAQGLVIAQHKESSQYLYDITLVMASLIHILSSSLQTNGFLSSEDSLMSLEVVPSRYARGSHLPASLKPAAKKWNRSTSVLVERFVVSGH